VPEYVNPNNHSVHLAGPDGKTLKIRSGQRLVLPEYFDRYRARGFIRLTTESAVKPVAKTVRPKKVKVPKPINERQQKRARNAAVNKARKIIRNKPQVRRNTTGGKKPKSERGSGRKLIVGRRIAADAAALLKKTLDTDCFPVSNNIGVGILSFNRMNSLKRLVESIKANTDLRRTTVFISDDGSTDPSTITYLDNLNRHPNFIVLKNKHNIGVAGNSNRLIRCLSRFKYGLLLNDDVEVLQPGWDEFYVEAMRRTGMHHFSYLQPGIYGANDGQLVSKGKLDLRVVQDKPHGAVLSFSREMLAECGYFNEQFGQYGMEHVDWSLKPHEFGLQEKGFFDVEGAEDYFKLHRDPSALGDNRSGLLKNARQVFASRQSKHREGPTVKSAVPEISYVIPFRNTDRQEAIVTVVNNIRAQRFPVVHIILAEQDTQTNILLEPFKPIQYYLAQEKTNKLFNKSKAFNLGVSKVESHSVILHDADMLVPGSYTSHIRSILKNHDACHVGCTVIYANKESTDNITRTGIVNYDAACERVVGYFEGGSLACRVNTYWKAGGFNEDFWGYGCEDCEFYLRLSQNSNWYEDRTVDFLHLWHGRADGWNQHHKENKIKNRQLEQTPMPTRINNQHRQLRANGYGDKLG
jgi:GT2 family glycosyltransferase